MATPKQQLLAALVCALIAPLAFAAEPVAAVEVGAAAPAAPSRFSLTLATGLAVARGAGSLTLGAGYDVTERFNLGIAVEYSPWFDYLAGKASAGTANAYATASYRWFGAGRFEVRSGLMAGASVLLFDTPGAPAGSVGLFLGANVLRVGAKLSDRVSFELSPDVVLAVPSLRGVPLVYSQFRLSAGIRFGL